MRRLIAQAIQRVGCGPYRIFQPIAAGQSVHHVVSEVAPLRIVEEGADRLGTSASRLFDWGGGKRPGLILIGLAPKDPEETQASFCVGSAGFCIWFQS